MGSLITPYEIDMALAAKHHELDRANQQLAYSRGDMFSYSGGKSGYRGRQRAYFHTARTNAEKAGFVMTLDEATALTRTNVDALAAYAAENAYEDDGYHGVHWTDWKGAIASHEARSALEVFTKQAERQAVVDAVNAEIDALEDLYTGWSRFFLVTSSPGHIHSSTHCSSCRYTTTYGWLPELSGKTEGEAVAAHGPALCSVCFPSAPVEHVGGKISKAQAAKRAA